MKKFKTNRSFLFSGNNKHISFGAIEHKKITLFDHEIDEKFISNLNKLTDKKFNIIFNKIKNEQNEGSCGIIALIKAFSISEFGVNNVKENIDPNYAVTFYRFV